MSDSEFEPSHLIKHDGCVLPFDAGKISAAIAPAGMASAAFGADAAEQLCQQGW